MKGLIKRAIVGAAIATRRRMDAGRATVLNYHRFPPEQKEQLRAQFAYLKRRCNVISMKALAACVRGEQELPRHAVVITVDDGHRDFYTVAYPILRELALPATMYLPTAFMDGAWLWFDRYQYIFRNAQAQRAEIRGMAPLPDGAVELGSREARDAAFYAAARTAQWLTAVERDALGERLGQVLRAPVLERPPEEYAPLTWDEAREMARNGMEFGGHTVNHPILETLKTEETLASEIAGCKARIEGELQSAVEHFAYPSGKAGEISAAAKAAVVQAGYKTASTTVVGQVQKGHDPYWLRRVGVDPSVDWLWFERCVAAVGVS
ncbi:MAG TPA: polysaccharide deacetylase family protein [Bryobacteraceae bacterium]|jgi:peptidoglycan/xylan/chitin deacetylase (PgdA/CDA1 family)|nr:polysaccharide deacetylase family protein [Bryobacteraceae bacterium]